MAGKRDEIVGVDDMADRLTEPSQKRTYVDFWNAAYRGLVPHGLDASTAPKLTEGNDDASPFDETEQYVTPLPKQEEVCAQPVIIIDDFSRVAGSVEQYFLTYQVKITDVGTTQIVANDPRRTRVRIVNYGPDHVFIGNNESVGVTGYQLIPGPFHPNNVQEFPLDMRTTREIWVTARTGLGATPASATLHVLIEYEKEV